MMSFGTPLRTSSTAAASPGERVYRAWWQDGSIDLIAGIAAALVGAGWVAGFVAPSLFAPALAVPAWMLLRRRLIEPRLGHVRFDAERRGRLRRAHLGLLLLGCGALVVFIGPFFFASGSPEGAGHSSWMRDGIAALPAALLGLLALLCALAFRIPRLGFHALAFVAAGAAVVALKADPGWAILAGGLCSALVGASLLVAFLRRFPRLSNELE